MHHICPDRQKGSAHLLIVLLISLLVVLGVAIFLTKKSTVPAVRPTPSPKVTPSPIPTSFPRPTPQVYVVPPVLGRLGQLELTLENFPVLDGATATQPIRGLIICRTFKINCKWRESESREMFVYQDYGDKFFVKADTIFDSNLYDLISNRNRNSKTHDAYIGLINKDIDLIINATEPSEDESTEAKKNNVELDLTPIGLDGFVFLVHSKNPIKNLTTQQLKGIYTGTITNWNQVGGKNQLIKAYVRQRNSGSQELMEKVFMKGDYIKEFPEEARYSGMMALIEGVDQDEASIGYSLYYYKNAMVDRLETNPLVKIISVDGVAPGLTSISLKKYPYVFNIYAVTRKDLDKNSLAYKLKLWLTTTDGQDLVKEAGYSPIYNGVDDL